MTPEFIAVRVLLVSRDTTTIQFLSQQMEHLPVTVETCPSADSATHRLCRAKFEGVIIDFDLGQDGVQLLETLRDLTSHRHAISYAVIDNPLQANTAFRAHANFVLPRPLSAQTVLRTLRAAYPMMFRERRRGYRHSIEMRTFVKPQASSEFWTTSVNISETGMAIASKRPLAVGERLQLEVELPGVADLICLTGEVCWNANERAGLKFVDVAPKVAERLQFWLSDRLATLVAQ